MIRKIVIAALGLVAFMAAPAAAQYATPPQPGGPPAVQPSSETPAVVEANNVSVAPNGAAPAVLNSGTVATSALARTGTDTDNLVKFGGILLAAGGAVTLVAAKRRRQTA